MSLSSSLIIILFTMYIHLLSTSMRALVYVDNVLSTNVYTRILLCTHTDKNMNYSTLGGNAAGKDVLHLVIHKIFSLCLEKIADNIRYYILIEKD